MHSVHFISCWLRQYEYTATNLIIDKFTENSQSALKELDYSLSQDARDLKSLIYNQKEVCEAYRQSVINFMLLNSATKNSSQSKRNLLDAGSEDSLSPEHLPIEDLGTFSPHNSLPSSSNMNLTSSTPIANVALAASNAITATYSNITSSMTTGVSIINSPFSNFTKLSNSNALSLEKQNISHVFNKILKQLLIIIASLSHSKDQRDCFVQLIEKCVEPCVNGLGWTADDFELFFRAVAFHFDHIVLVNPAVKKRYGPLMVKIVKVFGGICTRFSAFVSK